MDTPEMKLVYDDRCVSCTVAGSLAKKLDTHGSIELVGMHTEAGKALIQEHELDMEASAYVVSSDGRIYAKSSMVLATLESLNLPLRYVARALSKLPIGFRDRIYGFVSRHRYRGR